MRNVVQKITRISPLEERNLARGGGIGKRLKLETGGDMQRRFTKTPQEELAIGLAETARERGARVAYTTKRRAVMSFVGMSPDQLQAHIENNVREEKNILHKLRKMGSDKVPRWIFKPYGKFRSKWDLFSIFLIYYNAMAIPYNVAFSTESRYTSSYWDYPIDRFVDFFFFIDLITNFITAVEKNGKLITDPREIAKIYLRGWFIIDLISVVPFGVLTSSSMYRTNQLGKIFKLFRLFRLFRMFRIVQIISRLEYSLLISSSLSSIMKFCFIVLFSAHWFSCLFYGVSFSYMVEHEASIPDDDPGLRLGSSNLENYVTSLYWTMMTMTTVGYGDVRARTTSERILSIVAMIVGAGIFAYGITNIVALVSNLTQEETQFKQTMDEVNNYMEARELPPQLRGEIREYLHNARKSQDSKLEMEANILSELSSMLRSRIALSINDHFLKKMPFFEGSDPSFLLEISLSLCMVCYSPLEEVVSEGETGEEMYFIFRGAVEVLSKGKCIVVLGENQYFGEMAILRPECIRLATVRTLCFCELRMLRRVHFIKAIDKYPAMKTKISGYANHRFEVLNKISKADTDNLEQSTAKEVIPPHNTQEPSLPSIHEAQSDTVIEEQSRKATPVQSRKQFTEKSGGSEIERQDSIDNDVYTDSNRQGLTAIDLYKSLMELSALQHRIVKRIEKIEDVVDKKDNRRSILRSPDILHRK